MFRQAQQPSPRGCHYSWDSCVAKVLPAFQTVLHPPISPSPHLPISPPPHLSPEWDGAIAIANFVSSW